MNINDQGTKISDGAAADKEKQRQTFEKEQEKAKIERIGKAAEAFNKFHLSYANDFHLEPEEVVAAVFLENLNCREYYPTRLGGPSAYDQICQDMATWFQKNK